VEPIIWSLCLHVIVTDKNEWEKVPEKSPKMPKTRKYLQKWATVWLLQYALLCDSVTCHVVTMVTWLSFLDAYLRRTIPHTASFWITGTPHRTTLISQFVSTLATKIHSDSSANQRARILHQFEIKHWIIFKCKLPVSTSRAFAVSCWAKDLTKF